MINEDTSLQGKGVFIGNNGEIYKGSFRNGEFNGNGTLKT